MTLYSYTKNKKTPLRRFLSALSFLFIFSGVLILIWVLYPILAFQFLYSPKFATLMRPVAEADESENLATNLYQSLSSNFIDYTRASVWFPKAESVNLSDNLNNYSLSIPRLTIKDAFVEIGGDDLTKSLIHFTGPKPGQVGNPVIFGHSTLLWFYNPSDYKSIFSKLPDLEENDEIIIESDKVFYTYRIYEMFITSPTDLSVLNQTDKEEILTLVTCVPPGTYLKRFIVKARLTKV